MASFLNEDLPGEVVVIQWGINDVMQAPAYYKQALRAEVQRVNALGKRPVVTGLARIIDPAYVIFRDAGDQIAREVAGEEGAAFADWGSVPFNVSEMIDPIHPGPIYQGRLTERLAETLDAVAPECAG